MNDADHMRKEKAALETVIQEALADFEEATGLCVMDVNLDRIVQADNRRGWLMVKTEVQLI